MWWIKLIFVYIIMMVLFAACVSEQTGTGVLDINRYEGEIKNFETKVRAGEDASGKIIFIGDSNIRLWETLQADMSPLPVLNRGFGGATLKEITHFADRILLNYNPERIVIGAGENDIASGRSPEKVLADFMELAGKIKVNHPNTKIYYISSKPSPARKSLSEKMKQANTLIKGYCQSSNIKYIDVFFPVLKENQPNPDFYVQDKLHLNKNGYILYRNVIKPILLLDFNPTSE